MDPFLKFSRRIIKVLIYTVIFMTPLFIFQDRISTLSGGHQIDAKVVDSYVTNIEQSTEKGSSTRITQRFVIFEFKNSVGERSLAHSLDWSGAKIGEHRKIMLHPKNRELAYEMPTAWILPFLLYSLVAGIILRALLPKLTQNTQNKAIFSASLEPNATSSTSNKSKKRSKLDRFLPFGNSILPSHKQAKLIYNSFENKSAGATNVRSLGSDLRARLT